MIAASDERPRVPDAAGALDASAFAFADDSARLYGIFRAGLLAGPEGPTGTALMVLFDGDRAIEGHSTSAPADEHPIEEAFSHDAVQSRVVEPLQRWELAFERGPHRLELNFQALAEPAELDPGALGGLNGFEQLCRVHGEARIGGEPRRIDCLGRRGRDWGRLDVAAIALMRDIGAWFDDDRGLSLHAVRPASSGNHAAERHDAWVLDPMAPAPHPVSEPRLSTTYDDDGQLLRAGLELWVRPEDEFPRRAAARTARSTTIPGAAGALEVAFMEWTMEGHTGVGPYALLRLNS